MKLKTKILLLVLGPLIVLGVMTFAVGSAKITEVMKAVIENDLEGFAEQARGSLMLDSESEKNIFLLDENGELWNGAYKNISRDTGIADKVKEETGVDLTVFFGDTRYMTTVVDESGKRVLGTKASPKVTEVVLKGGQDYFAENVDVAGENYFAYYKPLYGDDSDKPVGIVFAGISQEDVEAKINNVLMTLMLIVVATAFVCSLAAFIMASAIVRQIKQGVLMVEEIAGGNLSVQADERAGKRRDEIGEMVRSILALREKLIATIGGIVDQAHMLNGSAQELSALTEETTSTVGQVESAVLEIADGANSQAGETQKATENVILIGNMIEETGVHVNDIYENAEKMRDSGGQASQTLEELEAINVKTKEAIEVIYEQTNTTNESALKIREATALITSIAEETNLLSLNAAIEAARAGEQGRGFAVVAGQIQKLAEQSNDSARAIELIIDTLIEDSEKAVTTMNEVKEIMEQQSEKVERTGQAFEEVKQGIDLSIRGVDDIKVRTGNMDQARVKVVDVVQNLPAIAEENAACTEETSASVTEVNSIVAGISDSATELHRIAEALKESVTFFKL